MKRVNASAGEPTHPLQQSVLTRPNSGDEIRRLWSRRRWAGASAIAVALLLALIFDVISGRTALMAAGTLLAFALSTDRLDQLDE